MSPFARWVASLGVAVAMLLVAGTPGEASIHPGGARLPYLAPTPTVVLDACERLARRADRRGLRLVVYCPPLAPTGPARVELAGGAPRLDDGYLIGVLGTTVRVGGWGGHWTFGAGSRDAMDAWVHPEGSLLRPVRTTRLSLAGVRVTEHVMTDDVPAFYSGHVVLVWRQRGLTHHVTVHGARWATRARAMTAAHIRAIRRCGERGGPHSRCIRDASPPQQLADPPGGNASQAARRVVFGSV